MYQVTVKGRNLEELKKAVADIHNELNCDSVTTIKPNVKLEKFINEEMDCDGVYPSIKPELVVDTPVVKEQAAVTNVVVHSDVDSEGFPWDKRIHSSGKTKDKYGAWINRRQVDPEYRETVKNELRTNRDLSAIVPIPPVIVAPPVQAPVAPPVQAPVAPPVNVGNGHTIDTFKANFPMILATLITEKKITQEYVNILKNHFGVEEIWRVSDAQKQEMFDNFASYGFIQKV